MRNKTYTFLIILIFSLYACEDFLDEASQDLIIPNSVTQFSEILSKEAYQKEDDPEVPLYLELMTDNVSGFDNKKKSSWNPRRNYEELFFGYYTWQKNPQRGRTGILQPDESWAWFYKSILVCNLIIEKIAKKEVEGTENEKNNLLAEAHFLRAWNYFNLVNLYGKPYREATAKSDLGVPINNLTIATDKTFKRASVAENYSLIESDLDKAIDNFEKTTINNNYFRGNLAVSYLLASRVALYQEKYNKVIEYANRGLEIKSVLQNLETLNKTLEDENGDGLGSDNPFIGDYNSEILFTYGNGEVFYGLFDSYEGVDQIFSYSKELRKMYQDDDLRGKYFFGDSESFKISDFLFNSCYAYGLRTAEFYLNRAEARIEKGDFTSGMEDINTVRAVRYASGKTYKLKGDSQQKARKFLREERRREFCFEGQRWFDIRRWGLSLERTYVLPQKNGQETYKLEADDDAYTLLIPEEIRLKEPNLERINRPIRNPQ